MLWVGRWAASTLALFALSWRLLSGLTRKGIVLFMVVVSGRAGGEQYRRSGWSAVQGAVVVWASEFGPSYVGKREVAAVPAPQR